MYELVSARLYYKHKWAIGYVVLVNGHIAIHGTKKEATDYYNKQKNRKE